MFPRDGPAADSRSRGPLAGAPLAVDGQYAPPAGRVSTDMLTVDITPLPGAGIGRAV